MFQHLRHIISELLLGHLENKQMLFNDKISRSIILSLFVLSSIFFLIMVGYDFNFEIITGETRTFADKDRTFSLEYPGRWALFFYGEEGNGSRRSELLGIFPINNLIGNNPNYAYLNRYEKSSVPEINIFREMELKRIFPTTHIAYKFELAAESTDYSAEGYYALNTAQCFEGIFENDAYWYIFGMCSDKEKFEQGFKIFSPVLDSFQTLE